MPRSTRPLARARASLGALATLVVLALTGCGHPATVDECEEIVEKIARLELERNNAKNPQAIADEIEATKKSVRESTMKECVGKRITRSAMECVRTAKSSKQITDGCFN